LSGSTRENVFFALNDRETWTVLLPLQQSKHSDMTANDLQYTITTDKHPSEVFSALLHPESWWSEEITGTTDSLNGEFSYHFEKLHSCKMKITELEPAKKLVWLVTENHFSFTKNQAEWTGTQIRFDVEEKGNQTEIRFIHEGLTPEHECFEICRDAWRNYIEGSLLNRINTGIGQPNPKEGRNEFQETISQQLDEQGFQIRLVLDAPLENAFSCINDVTKWWTENLEGESQKLGDQFSIRFGDVHYSKQKLVEFLPNFKVVWLVTESTLSFVSRKSEWTGTRIEFEVHDLGSKTEFLFTHKGLVPEIECYNGCSGAWAGYIEGSLVELILTGKGKPEEKEV